MVVRKKTAGSTASTSSSRKSSPAKKSSKKKTSANAKAVAKSVSKDTKKATTKTSSKLSAKSSSKRSQEAKKKKVTSPKSTKKSVSKKEISPKKQTVARKNVSSTSSMKRTPKKTTATRRTSSPKKKSTKTRRQPSRKSTKNDVYSDVSDMKFEENLHPRLEKLQDDSSSLAKDLHKQMDNLLGLPPEPNQKPGSEINSSNVTTTSTRDALKPHKIGFFEKLLGDKKEDKKEQENSVLQPNDKKENYDPFKLDISFGSSDSTTASKNSSPGDEEMKEYEREKKNLENFEKEIKELDKTEEITGRAASKDAGSESETVSQPVMKKETSQAHPDDVPNEFRVEKPYNREVPLKMSDATNSKEADKAKAHDSEKKEKDSKKADSSAASGENKSDEEKEFESEPTKLLPPSEKESKKMKKDEKKKSGFFSKLFGNSKDNKEKASKNTADVKSQEKDSKKNEPKDSLSKHSKALGKISAPSFDNPDDSKSNKKVSAEKIFSEETEGPKKKNDDKNEDPHDGKNLTEATSVVAESQTSTPANPENVDGQDTDFERPTDEPQNLTPSSPESSNAKTADDDSKSKEQKEIENMENEKDEHSTSFVTDSLADELSTSSADAGSGDNNVGGASKKSSEDGQDTDKSSDKSALKLQVKKDKLEKEIAELEETLKTKKAMFDDRTTKLDRKEKELDKREAEIDDRENILLTLQTDLIRERKELDKREFEFFMSRENSALPGRPTLTLSVDDDLKALPKGMSDERMKIEQLLNQTRTFAISKNFDKAKTSYNRLVDKFHAAELSPSEKKVVHLSIKELFNDINLLMNTVQDARQDGTLDSGDTVTVEGANKQDGRSNQGNSNGGSADEQVFAVADSPDSKSGDDGSHVQ